MRFSESWTLHASDKEQNFKMEFLLLVPILNTLSSVFVC